jgi:trehalose 6-phosphate synthase
MRLPDSAHSGAVLIGTARYSDDELHDLDSVRANLADLELRLTDERFGVLRRVQTVVDPTSAAELGSLVAEEAEFAQDTFFVYYAGHGLVDRHGELYLGLSTTRSGRVEYTAMPFDFIRRAFLDSPARNRVLILDCCFSGRAIEAMGDPGSVLSGQMEIAGTYTLASSSATQPSHAPAGARHTSFTGVLIDLLSHGVPHGDEFITLDATYAHLTRTLLARSLPKPRVRLVGTAGQLVLARNPAWSPPATDVPSVRIDPGVARDADFVVVTAHLPFDLDSPVGEPPRWTPRPDGLRAAFGPTPPAGKNAWIGWCGVADESPAAFEDGELAVLPVPLSRTEVSGCLEGFANGTVWPLYHSAVLHSVLDGGWWDAYVRVNQRFAEAAAQSAARAARVWVHDYQLQLVPGMLRALRPDLRIGFFMDIPFPPRELFMQLPWRAQIIRGLIGADVVGFHQPLSATNFISLARHLLRLPVQSATIQVDDRRLKVASLAGSIDASGVDTVARSRESIQRAKQIRADLGNPKTVMLGAQRLGHVKGISELDYVLGISRRLQALYDLLSEGRVDPQDIAVVELVGFAGGIDSRRYVPLGGEIDQIVAKINGQFSSAGRPIVHYMQRAMSPEELVAYYLTADVLAITPMRDGMNLVAKEYVASRHDLAGTLLLSEFSGAAAELTSAFLVNTYDIENLKNAMDAAIGVDPAEGRRRMRALRRQVVTHDSRRWAGAFLAILDPDHATTH